MDDLQTFLKSASQATDLKIEQLLDRADIAPPRLLEALRWSLFGGGKRFRPALMLAVGEVFGIPAERLLTAAASVELVHTYSLIHDDLPAMDDDDLRRGRETCHRKFDEATAILAGDALQVLAFKIIADDERSSAATLTQLVARLAAAALRMVSGQQMDLESEGSAANAEIVQRIHQNKTGALIRYSAEAALIVGEIRGREAEIISDFAERLGLMYQISDDLLDVTRSTAEIGKVTAKDASAQKVTYPALLGSGASLGFLTSLRDEAVRSLTALDRETTRLVQIANFVVERRS